MNKEKIDALKELCYQTLKSNGIKPTSVTGRKMIHFFWAGALYALGEQNHPITMLLACGRHEDLVKEPPKETA